MVEKMMREKETTESEIGETTTLSTIALKAGQNASLVVALLKVRFEHG